MNSTTTPKYTVNIIPHNHQAENRVGICKINHDGSFDIKVSDLGDPQMNNLLLINTLINTVCRFDGQSGNDLIINNERELCQKSGVNYLRFRKKITELKNQYTNKQ